MRQPVKAAVRAAGSRSARHCHRRVVADHDQPLLNVRKRACHHLWRDAHRLQRVVLDGLFAGLVELCDEVVRPHLRRVYTDVRIVALPPRVPLVRCHADGLHTVLEARNALFSRSPDT